MATKPPLGSLYAEGEEEQKLVDEIKGSYAKLREALDARQNQLFDPVMLAMAQGFLAPTKSGSFGESLGNVAALVGPAQESENKRQREIAEMRMQLAQQELAQRQSARGEQAFQRLIGGGTGLPSAAPAAGEATGAQPLTAGAPSGAPARASGLRNITPEDILRLGSMPGMSDRAKQLADAVKLDRERYAIAMNGIVFDKQTGQYLNLEIPGQKQEEYQTPYGKFLMRPSDYSKFKEAEDKGLGRQWIQDYTTPKSAPTTVTPPGTQPAGAAPAGTPSGTSQPPTKMPTVGEARAQEEAAKVRATKTAEAEVSRTQQKIEEGSDATGRLAQYASLRAIAGRPDSKEIFGILNRPDVGSAILNLISEGVRTQRGSIQASALEDALRNVGLKQDQIDRYRFALATMANIQLQQAKLAQGQGAVSNFERELFANAVISPKDNPGTILAKLSMMEERARLDRQMASALRKSKMDYDEFVETDEYRKLVDAYLGKVSTIASNIGVRTPSRAPAPSGGSTDARTRLRETLRMNP